MVVGIMKSVPITINVRNEMKLKVALNTIDIMASYGSPGLVMFFYICQNPG